MTQATEKLVEQERSASNSSALGLSALRVVAQTYDDYQDVRKATANRVRDIARKQLEGIAWDEVEDEKSREERLEDIQEYSDAQLRDKVEQARDEGLLSAEQEDKIDQLFAILGESKSLERAWKDQMHSYLNDNVIFQEFLSEIRGIGPVLSAKLLKAFGDCSDYATVSSLWCHTGNHTVPSDADQSRKAPKRHEGQRFNPDLRTLTWKVSDCLMKNNRGVYRECYDTTKHRELRYLENNEPGSTVENEYGDKKTVVESQGHAHNRALRKARKLFLSHYWEASRELTGQETQDTYAHSKLGHDNKVDWERALEVERQQ